MSYQASDALGGGKVCCLRKLETAANLYPAVFLRDLSIATLFGCCHPCLRKEGHGIVRCQHAWPEEALNEEEASLCC